MANGETKCYWFRGRKYTIQELSETYQAETNKLTPRNIRWRISMGWSIESVLLEPIGPNTRKDPSSRVYCERCWQRISTHKTCNHCEILIHREIHPCSSKICIYSHTYSRNGVYCIQCSIRYDLDATKIDTRQKRERNAQTQARREREKSRTRERNRRTLKKFEYLKKNHRCAYCKNKIDDLNEEVQNTTRTLTTEQGKKTIQFLKHKNC